MTRALLTTFALSLAVACGGSSKAGKTDDGTPTETPKNGSAEGQTAADTAPQKVAFETATPAYVTSVQYVDSGLAVGFGDGRFAVVNPKSGDVTEKRVSKAQPVANVSPNASLVLLATSPPAIVNAEGELILQMNTVPEFESAVFAKSGLGIYVADKVGKVRIWGQSYSFEERDPREKMEDYLNRQAPDFHVEFPSVRGPIHMTDDEKLIVGDSEGTIRLWDPTRPSSSKRLMKLNGAVQSIASAAGHIFVTSVLGALKVGKTDGSGYLPWSKDAKGKYAAATPLAVDEFFVLDDGALSAIKLEDGSARWSTELPAGRPCGLAASKDGSQLAACVGNYIALFDAKSGAPISYGYAKTSSGFVWKKF